jgi:UDP:flavonoid glycosyltransferase YjiC (YdhE family)
MPMIRLALEATRPLDGRVQFVFSEGRPRGSPEPRKVGQSTWYYEWCPVRDEIFAMSDLVVLRGGHVALSQAIQFGKPIVTIPIDNHGEQLGNSQKVAQLGLGIMVKPKKLRPEQLAQAIEQALSDTGYARKARELMAMTEKMNGIENVARIIRSYI